MKHIIVHAEEALIHELGRLRTDERGACFLHIKDAALALHEMVQLPQLLTRWIGVEEGTQIIQCHDNDIFVFSPHMTLDIFQRIRERIFDIIKSAGRIPDPTYVSFYDMNINSAAVIEFAHAKLQRRIQIQKKEEEKSKQEEKQKKRDIILKIKPKQKDIEALSQRRQQDIGRANILVVEDDPFSRKLIDTCLGTHYNVHFASDGLAAIQSYAKLAPHIVFLDIELPDIDGHDVLSKIKEIDPASYIVMLSGNGHRENVKRAVEAGAKGFIAKPFNKEKLLQYINKKIPATFA